MGMKTKSVKKKTVIRKKMVKLGRPKSHKTFVELGLRATTEERTLLDKATVVEAKRLGITGSRNNFCMRAAIAAAKKELRIVDDEVITEDAQL
jgi:uncharacterized protein (DUF1778 family)